MTQSSSSEQRITIGRVADNTVVLDQANISGHHARLIINGGEIVLEDLGSTNGTSVGKVENKISRAKVEASDTVFFGSTPYQVDRLIKLANQPVVASPPSQVSTASKSSDPGGKAGDAFRRLTFAAVSVALASCLALLFLAWRSVATDETKDTSPTAADQPVTLTEDDHRNAIQPDPGTETRTPEARDVAADTDSVETTPPGDSVDRSLFLIVCSDPKNETPFRVGNGFAIGPNRIATSASVIDAIAELSATGFPNSSLYSPATGET
ncbi:FHA domain-containing protein [Rhodopirellula sp. JC639]|uniref:FHA domain-containing protein n=1 Tax=Stieleria mannarensis TaxID=2755585 RepID=UPI00160323A8|nr:FHA domain-containing protein [Rhodopirellula sp. JC639]